MQRKFGTFRNLSTNQITALQSFSTNQSKALQLRVELPWHRRKKSDFLGVKLKPRTFAFSPLHSRTSVKWNSVQEGCAICFAVHLWKFEILQTTWRNKTKNIKSAKSIGEKLKTKGLMFFVSFFSMWFARFQILICKPQSIWRKLLVLSWLYLILCCNL